MMRSHTMLALLAGPSALILAMGVPGTARPSSPQTVPAEGAPAIASAPTRVGVAGIRPGRPGALAIGPGGQIYITDAGRDQILERLPGGRFKVIAGRGKAGFSGDGGSAVAARLHDPRGMVVSTNGTLYIADSGNERVRAISPRGTISTVAGNGHYGWVTTGTHARAAGLGQPAALTIGPRGALYIADDGLGEVLRLGSNGVLARVAGIRGPYAGVYGIGHPATQASADGPDGLALDRTGDLYIAGLNTKTLLMVTPTGRMTLPLGKDGFYPRGDGGLVAAPDGSVIAMDGQKIIRLSPKGAHTIVNFSGRRINGIRGFLPNGLAVAPNGAIYTDTYAGNGFANKTALIEIRPGGRIRVLWTS